MHILRCGMSFVSALAILVLLPPPVLSQIDSEATNGVIGTPDNFPSLFAPNSAVLNQAQFLGGGNDVDYFSANLFTGDALIGMTTHLASLPGNFDAPNTITSVFDSLTLTPSTFNDNDGGGELPGGASRGSVFRLIAPMGGVYPIGVTGFDDQEFDGANSGNGHAETGQYLLTAAHVNRAMPGGDFSDTDALNDAQVGADLVTLNATGAAVSVADLVASGMDVDFFRLNNLTAGQVLSAMTAPLEDAIPFNGDLETPDTVLGLFDSNGLLLTNDDAGGSSEGTIPSTANLASDSPFLAGGDITGSALRAVIPNDGNYFLAVSGADDLDFDGLSDILNPNNPHGQIGRYALLVSVFGEPDGGGGKGAAPEPGTIWLTITGFATLWQRTRRRRKRP